MKRLLITSAALALTIAGTAAFADSQLYASAGLSAAEASSLTLSEIAALKFNADTRRDDQQTFARSRSVPVDPSAHGQLIAVAGVAPADAAGMTLNDIFVAKRNESARGDEYQVIVSSRNAGTGGSHDQLIAQAGLSADEAQGMTLDEIFAAKIDRDNALRND